MCELWCDWIVCCLWVLLFGFRVCSWWFVIVWMVISFYVFVSWVFCLMFLLFVCWIFWVVVDFFNVSDICGCILFVDCIILWRFIFLILWMLFFDLCEYFMVSLYDVFCVVIYMCGWFIYKVLIDRFYGYVLEEFIMMRFEFNFVCFWSMMDFVNLYNRECVFDVDVVMIIE